MPLLEPKELDLDGAEYAHIPLHDAMLAAGDGYSNHGEAVIDQLAFRRDWLRWICITASDARLARVQGDSMQPSMWDGDMILIDTKSNDPQVRARDAKDQRRSPVYAMIDNGEARVKRVERPAHDMMMLISDNPDYAPELRQGNDLANIKIIGKVVWWGHTVKESGLKMERFNCLFIVLVVSACATGVDTRKDQPLAQFSSTKTIDEYVSCLVPTLDDFYGQVLLSGSSKFVAQIVNPGHEYEVVPVGGQFHDYYVYTVNVTRDSNGTVARVYKGQTMPQRTTETIISGTAACA